MRDQDGKRFLRHAGRIAVGAASAAALVAVTSTAAFAGEPLRPDPSPTAPAAPAPTPTREPSPDSAPTPRPAVRQSAPAAPAPASVPPVRARVTPAAPVQPATTTVPAKTKPKPVAPARPRHVAQRHRVVRPAIVALGVRFALAAPNPVVKEASLALPAALALLVLVAASGSFVGLVMRLRRELAW